ncbi:MAG: endonuclease/exonuclease/phosphatase family protein [archaeon]
MKIINWNVFSGNKKIEDSLKLVFKRAPDIICLQEFPVKSKKILNSYPDYDFVYCKDYSTLTDFIRRTTALMVVGIKKKIKFKSKIIRFPHYKGYNLIRRYWKWDECREGLVIDFNYKGKKVRLFNVHFSFAASPDRRVFEFEKISSFFNKKNNIVCGDFNIISKRRYKYFFGWIFTYRFKDYFKNEKEIFSNLFKENNLKNIFKGNYTHRSVGMQLDYVLIPNSWNSGDLVVDKESSLYSDHLLMDVDLNP